eukprot:GFUD01023386.1.p1 GENE.GFUD01023386.1~~GFUD01023386.1.p1  ORF type:complete len:248 (+),score=84.69 GFUD01023386.1:85-828(+)
MLDKKKVLEVSLPLKQKLEKMKKQELIALCTELDLDSFGTKTELVQRIKLLVNEAEINKLNLESDNDNDDDYEVKREKDAIRKDTEDKEEAYDLQFVNATDTKIRFVNDPSEDILEGNGGVKIFLPSDSPVDFLLRWEKQVRNQKQPRSRRFCGAIMMSITEELGKQMDSGGVWTGGKGVLVCRVLRGSPAHGGGLAPGDCIIEVNGGQVFTLRDIYKELEGEGTLDCTVIREGKLMSGVCFLPLGN